MKKYYLHTSRGKRAFRRFERSLAKHWKSLPAVFCYGIIATLLCSAVYYDHNPVAYAPAVAQNGYGTILTGSWIERHEAATDAATKAVASTATNVPGKTTPAAAPVVPQSTAASLTGFGISFGDTLPWISPTALDNELKDTASIGFKWIRMDFDWMNIQPDSASQYNWSDHDRVVKTAAKYNLKVLGLITYTPPWARPGSCNDKETCAPASNAQYAAFAAGLAGHYGPLGVQTWEIWNEPNLQGSWRPNPDATSYSDMLKQSYTAIKKVNANAVVVSGGISSVDDAPGSINQLTFLNSMYTAGAKGSFDALGYHSYSYPAGPDEVHAWSGWSMMNALSTSLHSIMSSHGDGSKKIWSTEYGAPTNGPGNQATENGYDPSAGEYYVSESLQARMASQAITDVRAASWSGPLFWYSYKDLGTDASTNENFFGLLRADGSQKPAYATIKNLLR